VQLRRRGHLDIAFLAQLARDRLRQRLPCLHAAAGQMPAADIAVPDQENAALIVDHQRAHAERHGARETPVHVHEPPQRGLERAARPIEAEPLHRPRRASRLAHQ
jgi:hypothetical protein